MGSGSGSYRRCFTGHRIRSRIVLTIGPAEDCLDSIMEAAEANRARDLDTPPDWRLDAEEGDFQLVDRGLELGGGHKAHCPPGTGNCRNRRGDRFPGTAWIGQYWRQDASRQHGARRMEDPTHRASKAPHGGYEEDSGETVAAPMPRATMRSKRAPPMPNGATAVLAAVESLPFGVAVTDIHGIVTWANPTFAQLTGCTPDQLLGQSAGEFDWEALSHAAPSSDPWRGET